MTRLDHTTIRMGSLYRARPVMTEARRIHVHGSLRSSHTPSRAWRIVAAVVVGVVCLTPFFI